MMPKGKEYVESDRTAAALVKSGAAVYADETEKVQMDLKKEKVDYANTPKGDPFTAKDKRKNSK